MSSDVYRALVDRFLDSQDNQLPEDRLQTFQQFLVMFLEGKVNPILQKFFDEAMVGKDFDSDEDIEEIINGGKSSSSTGSQDFVMYKPSRKAKRIMMVNEKLAQYYFIDDEEVKSRIKERCLDYEGKFNRGVINDIVKEEYSKIPLEERGFWFFEEFRGEICRITGVKPGKAYEYMKRNNKCKSEHSFGPKSLYDKKFLDIIKSQIEEDKKSIDDTLKNTISKFDFIPEDERERIYDILKKEIGKRIEKPKVIIQKINVAYKSIDPGERSFLYFEELVSKVFKKLGSNLHLIEGYIKQKKYEHKKIGRTPLFEAGLVDVIANDYFEETINHQLSSFSYLGKEITQTVFSAAKEKYEQDNWFRPSEIPQMVVEEYRKVDPDEREYWFRDEIFNAIKSKTGLPNTVINKKIGEVSDSYFQRISRFKIYKKEIVDKIKGLYRSGDESTTKGFFKTPEEAIDYMVGIATRHGEVTVREARVKAEDQFTTMMSVYVKGPDGKQVIDKKRVDGFLGGYLRSLGIEEKS